MGNPPVYRRILLKLSGEALMGDQRFGIDPEVVARVADEVGDVHRMGVQTAVVLGGGNIIRGVAAAAQGIDRVAGDHMGLLATVILTGCCCNPCGSPCGYGCGYGGGGCGPGGCPAPGAVPVGAYYAPGGCNGSCAY